MAIVVESTTVTLVTSNATSIDVDMPATRPDGDVYYMVVGHDSNPNSGYWPDTSWFTHASGWTEIWFEAGSGGFGCGASGAWKEGASEPASYNVTADVDSEQWAACVTRTSGVDTADPVNAFITDDDISSPENPSLTHTATGAGNLIIGGGVVDSDEVVSGDEPSGTTWLAGGYTGSSGGIGLFLCTYDSNSSPTGVAEWGAGNDQCAMHTIAFNEGSGSTPRTEIIGAASFDWTGQALAAARAVVPGAASFNWSGQALAVSRAVVPGAASFDWTGQQANPARAIVPGAASFNWATEALIVPKVVVPGAGVFNWAGQLAIVDRTVVTVAASFDWSGQPISIVSGRQEVIDAGAFNWSAQALTVPRVVVPGAGTFDWTGQLLGVAKTINTTPGTFNWSAQGITVPKTVVPAAGAFNWSGQPIVVDRTVIPGAATWNWQGQLMATARAVGVGPATFSFSAQGVTVPRIVVPAAATFNWSGQAVVAGNGTIIEVGAGVFTWTGQGLSVARAVIPAAGAFNWQGRTFSIDVGAVETFRGGPTGYPVEEVVTLPKAFPPQKQT